MRPTWPPEGARTEGPEAAAPARGTDLASSCLIIPAFNPDNGLVLLVRELVAAGFDKIIVVDDGSDARSAAVFESLKHSSAVHLIVHPLNRGKGAALKTAFADALKRDAVRDVITLDADGQHLPEDVVAMAHAAAASPGRVLLGVRAFDGAVPLRSRFGNQLTRWLFSKVTGTSVSDTQTGLRLFPVAELPSLCALDGDRYEYEMNVLNHIARMRVPMAEVSIKTVYIENNRSSHFRPLIDSARIYFVLFRDAIISLSSFGLDIAAFALIFAATQSIAWSVVLARGVSVVYNFVGQKFIVFPQPQGRAVTVQIAQYAALALVLVGGSVAGVKFLAGHLGFDPVVAKILVDAVLYAGSFVVRRAIIFR